MAGLLNGSILYGSRNYVYCIWCHKIIGYFSRDFYCLAFQFDLAFGVLLAAVGVVIIIRRNVVVNLIFGIFGILILADALFKIQTSIDAKKSLD